MNYGTALPGKKGDLPGKHGVSSPIAHDAIDRLPDDQWSLKMMATRLFYLMLVISIISAALCIFSMQILAFEHKIYHVSLYAEMQFRATEYIGLAGFSLGRGIPLILVFYMLSLVCLSFRNRFHGKVMMSSVIALIAGIASLLSLTREDDLFRDWGRHCSDLGDIPGEFLVLYAIMLPQWIYHFLSLLIGFRLSCELLNHAPRKEG